MGQHPLRSPSQPILVIGRMGQQRLPVGELPVPHGLRDHGHRPVPEVPIPHVVRPDVKVRVLVARLEQSRILKSIGHPEGAIVEEVVAQPGVGHRGHGRGGLERGVRPHFRHFREPPRIRGSRHSHPPVGVGEVMDHPVDRVPRVGALVRARRVRGQTGGPVHQKGALRLVASPDVGGNEDVFLERQLGEQVVVVATGGAMRGSGENDRERAATGVLRRRDLDEQLHAVPHRDHRVGDGIEGVGHSLGRKRGHGGDSQEDERVQAAHRWARVGGGAEGGAGLGPSARLTV